LWGNSEGGGVAGARLGLGKPPEGEETGNRAALAKSLLGSPVRMALRERWTGEIAGLGLSFEDLEQAVLEVSEKYHYGSAHAGSPAVKDQLAFVASLHLEELMLARACAAGKTAAWDKFLARYREPLYQAAYAIARQDALGRELADSLYADLYGLREKGGLRQSPLMHYHGRGSLAGWLRSVLAQRFIDWHRANRREQPLEESVELAVPSGEEQRLAQPEALARLEQAVERELGRLDEEQRFLLAAYYLDGRTLKQIAGVLGVHESTVSRTLARLAAALRKQIARNLRQAGVSRREVDEMMDADVRDLRIPLKKILQEQERRAFPEKQKQLLAAMEGGGVDG